MRERRRAPIEIRTLHQAGEVLADHDDRISDMEEIADVAKTTWRWIQIGYPVLIGMVVAASGEHSLIGQFFTAFLKIFHPE